ncbi:MAG: diaminopimelate decarboxylase [Spirochaetaceae bacterium]|nr:MAG: diaminopimelate decarboxylase [Spirochaetaceae bacterium]
MKDRTLPFDRPFLDRVVQDHPTPFHIYDEAAIRDNARAMYKAFSWVPDRNGGPGGFCNYFAVKALPNPHILRVLREEGMGFDCSSIAELVLCERIGVRGEQIMFTSNDTPLSEYAKARELGGIINLDDITHIEYLAAGAGMPELICMRYNPGPLREGNVIIGKPEEAKYGFTREQIIEGYRAARDLGAVRFGLHTMVASNELNPDYFVETAVMLFELAVELKQKLGIRVEFVNLGGGIGIPYRPEQTAVDYQRVSDGVRAAYGRIVKPAGLDPLPIVLENGRVVTGPYGYLVTRAIHRKDTYKHYIGLDGNMANLMRPGMYGAYHHITVPGRQNAAADHTYDVVGSLCENNDKFAIDRRLPQIEIGDLVVIHDTGAHGHSMGFNYNGKLRSAELLLKPDGSVQQIRRAETLDDYFATLDLL